MKTRQCQQNSNGYWMVKNSDRSSIANIPLYLQKWKIDYSPKESPQTQRSENYNGKVVFQFSLFVF